MKNGRVVQVGTALALASTATIGIVMTWRGPPPPETIAALPAVEPSAVDAARAAVVRAAKEHGEDSAELAQALDRLVTRLYKSGAGASDEALAVAERAVRIRQTSPQASAGKLGRSLNNLGGILLQRGDLVSAREYFRRVVAERREGGASPVALARSLNSLAEAERQLGSAAEARDLYRTARQLLQAGTAEGDQHSLVATLRLNEGHALATLRDLEAAREAYEDANERWRHDARRASSRLRALNSLGRVLHDLRKHSAAGECFAQALTLWRRMRLPELSEPPTLEQLRGDARALRDTQLATLLNNIAYLLLQSKASDRVDCSRFGLDTSRRPDELASDLLELGLEIRERKLGRSHPDCAWTIANLGLLARQRGDLLHARELFEETRSIRTEALGALHPETSDALAYLADVSLRIEHPQDALEYALRADAARRGTWLLEILGLSEHSANRLRSSKTHGLRTSPVDLVLESVLQLDRAATLEQTHLRRAWDAVIRSRFRIFDALVKRQASLQESSDAETRRLQETLDAVRRQLGQLAFLERPTRSSGERFNELCRRAEELETRLASLSGKTPLPDLGLEEVAASLDASPGRNALVGFVTLRRPAYKSVSITGHELGRQAAFVRRADGQLEWVDLGTAGRDPWSLDAWREALDLAPLSDTSDASALSQSWSEACSAMRRQVWEPIRRATGDADRIFIVPVAGLWSLRFATLPGDVQPYLVEESPEIIVLSNERDLIAPGHSEIRRVRGLLAMGDPDFESPATERGRKAKVDEERLAQLSEALGRRSSKRGRYSRVAASAEEVDAVVGLWNGADRPEEPALRLLREQATETALRQQASSCRVLHIATHGLFIDRISSRLGSRPKWREGAHDQRLLLSSALVLAGASYDSRNLPVAANTGDDGLLTAEELGSIDLSACELMVLSACNTGAGTLLEGEGAFGLVRAARIAGAESVVYSLWPVDDRSTREWMEAFYAAWLGEDHPGVYDAVARASRVVLDARRESGRSTHPFYWAAFRAAGPYRRGRP